MTAGDTPDGLDLEEWVLGVSRMLRERAIVYEREPDPLLKRNKVINMVADLATALQQLPSVADRDLFPLKDLMIFDEDMHHGRRHPWSIPTNWGGTNIGSMAKTERQVYAVAATAALIDSGMRPTSAYKETAKLLKAAGRVVSYQRIQAWYLAFKRGEDPRLARAEHLMQDQLLAVACRHGGTLASCPASSTKRCPDYPPIAAKFAAWAISSPTFRDWFVS